MKSCKFYEKLMIESLLGVLDDRSRFALENHTAGCSGCQEVLQEMRNVLNIMGQRERQNPNPEFMNRFWAELSPRLQNSRGRSFRAFVLFRSRLVLPLAAALCLILGIWIGRHSAITDNRPSLTGFQRTGKGKGIPVETRTSQVLERSQRVLLAFSNFDVKTDDPAILNLPYQKSMARYLVQETGELKAELPDDTDRKLALLLSDLELILLQIANLEDTHDMDNIEIIRDGVNRRSVLFKIQMNTLGRSGEQAAGSGSRHI